MASIKERAAALNLAEKLCARPPEEALSAAVSRPVPAWSMWCSVISLLRSSVTVKRRRLHLKSHADCFLGSEAVDVLAEHITHVRGLEGATVSRARVACVCQALLECDVFQAVGTRVFGKGSKSVFQDSKSALYRFTGVRTPRVKELEKGALVKGIHELFCSSAPADRQEDPTGPSGPLVQTSTPFRLALPSVTPGLPQTPGLSGGLSVGPLMGSLSPSRVQTDSVLPPSLVEEVWQEQTLLRLLSLVELPLLDGVLQCSTSSPSSSDPPVQSDPELICSSNHLDRQILKAFKDSQEDSWLRAALDCLDFLPDQPVVALSRELPHCLPTDPPGSTMEPAGGSVQQKEPAGGSIQQKEPAGGSVQQKGGVEPACRAAGGSAQCKLLLYNMLVKHYNSTHRRPLLPPHLTEVYSAVTDLLVKAKLSVALEALQLCLKLLPPSSRHELQRLLVFMSVAADARQVKVDKEVENRLAVRRSFSRAVLHSKTLSKEEEDLLLVFMLGNIKEIFKIPGALHKLVSEKLAGLVEGKQPDVTGSTFCQPVSSRTHAESTRTTTSQELWILLNNIHLDAKTSAKERRRRLQQFHLAHPQIFNQYFGDSAASVL